MEQCAVTFESRDSHCAEC